MNPNPYHKSFSIDARTIIHLGRDSIKHPTTALLELVKNSYDADATVVNVDIQESYIRIADNGTGMTDDQLADGWLRIGFSNKGTDKETSGTKRRKTGEKGIGRLSADRLGAVLDLRSKPPEETDAYRLVVNWNDFDVEGQDLSAIKVTLEPTNDYSFTENKRKNGTEILIKELRHKWVLADIEQAYSELVSLVSPFANSNDFKIIFNNYISPELNGVVESQYFDVADLSINAIYKGVGSTITYKITDRSEDPEVIVEKELEWATLSQYLPTTERYDTTLNCGPASIQILFYPRTAKNPLLEEKGLTVTGLKKFLDKNLGIKLYRDNVSVKPYGYNNELAGDWLGLARRKERDPAGLKRSTYKIASSQLVGAISIGRDTNPQLHDGASREGLVENDAFFDLRALTLSCVTLLEQYRHNKAIQPEKPQKKKPAEEEVDDLSGDLDEIETKTDRLKEKLIKEGVAADTLEIVEGIQTSAKSASEKSKRVEEILDHSRSLSGLATVGISAAVFGHETQTAISLFRTSVAGARSKLTLTAGPDVERAVEKIDKSLKFASQVDAWGAFGLMRVRRDKRTKRKLDVHKILNTLLDDIAHTFEMGRVSIERNLEDVTATSFEMNIESVVLNLVMNAYAAVRAPGIEKRKIEVILRNETDNETEGFSIIIRDSGPGINSEAINLIWQPLYTTKRNRFGHEEGTGLGLSIVSSTVTDLGGRYGVLSTSELGGAEFKIWLPKN